MQEHRFKTVLLSDRVVRELPSANDQQYVVRDTDLSGFFVVVGKRTKTYTIQADVYQLGRRRTVRKSIGRFGELSCRQARAEAKRVLGNIATKREGPAEIGPTLAEAWQDYHRKLVRKERSHRTIESYENSIERVLADWLEISLAELSLQAEAVQRRHDEITERNGPVCANHAMQALRAIYNYAKKRSRFLPPENPTCLVEFNPVLRRNSGMSLDDVPSWLEELERVQNPVRRQYHLMLLLSGSRPGAMAVARWEHLDVARRALHIPRPKGGSKRAYDIPLSRGMLGSLAKCRRASRMLYPENSDWIFPSLAPSGHLEEWKERRTVLSRHGNDLRHSYAAIAKSLRVDPLFLKLLMNHSIGDVTDGYAANTSLHRELTREQERITKTILSMTSRGV